jgi:hypothetical protein
VGRPDFIYTSGAQNTWNFVEMKSIKKDGDDGFDALEKPKPSHIHQLSVYYALAKKLGYSVNPVGSVFYISKGYTFKGSVYKEYTVDLSEPNTFQFAQSLLDDAASIYNAIRKGTLPPRIAACPSGKSSTAKKCQKCESCFSRE